MTTILRSSRYIRCLNHFARRIIVERDSGRLVKRSLGVQAQCANYYLTKNYATIAATKRRNDRVPTFHVLLAKLEDNVQRYGRVFKNEVEVVLAKVRDTGDISPLDALLLIRCCGNFLIDVMPTERTAFVQEIWNTLDALKIPIDVSHFNALLRVYLENDYEFSPIEFLTSMKDKGVEPNRITYQRLMLRYCKQGDIDGATKILEFMKEKDILLNEAVFNALITGHSAAGDLQSAQNVINVMKEAGVKPSTGTYMALLNAYAKRGDMAAIKETVQQCNAKHLYLQDTDFFDIIQTLVINDHTQMVNEIFPLMPKSITYNFDARDAILKTLDVGNVDVALKILSTMRKQKEIEDDQPLKNGSGVFLIRKLVNSKYAVEHIVEVCQTMQQRGVNTFAFPIAIERSLANGDTSLTIPLLEAWKKNGGEIREHYFWPLLCVHGKAGNYQAIIDVVQAMTTKFNLMPTMETVKSYILPYTAGKWDDTVASLKSLGLPHETIVASIANRMLTDGKLRKTAMFMLNYPSAKDPEPFYKPLANAVNTTHDAPSYAIILRLLCAEMPDSVKKTKSSVDIVDSAVRVLIDTIPSNKSSVVRQVLEQLVEAGLSMSPKVGEECRAYLADNVNPVTEEILEKLTSLTLTPIPISELESKFKTSEIMEMEQQHLDVKINGGMNSIAERRELSAALKSRDAAAVQNIIETLESRNFSFSPAALAEIIAVFCQAENMEMAEKWFNKFRRIETHNNLDIRKTMAYAALLIKNGRFDDALKFIAESPRHENPDTYPVGTRRQVKALLGLASQTGDVERTKKLFDALRNSNYCVVDNIMLGPLVKVHLVQNDVAGAFEEFEKACKTYQFTPMKNELSKKLIEIEDAESLQRLTDLSTEIHGATNCLFDLVFAFIESGRLRQARKILETTGLRLKGRKLANVVDRYVKEDLNDFLERFVDLTKGLMVIDRQEFYNALLTAYYKRNNWQRGLSLWTMIQDENEQPSIDFLRTLAELLKKNDQPIPFTLKYNSTENWEPLESKPDSMHDFYAAIQAKDVQRAEETLKSIPTDHAEFSSAISTMIITYLEQCNDLEKAMTLCEKSILKHGRTPRAHAIKAIWHKCVEANEFDKLRKHSNIYDTKLRQRLRLYKYLSRALLKEVGMEEFLKRFKIKLADPDANKLQVCKEFLHFSTMIQEFHKDPIHLTSFYETAEELAMNNVFFPINLIWCYYFEKNDPEADVLWSKYLVNSTHVLCKHIVTTCLNNNDVAMAERLYKMITTNKAITANAKLFVLTNLVDLYNKNGRTEEALKIVQDMEPAAVATWSRDNPIIVHNFREAVLTSGKSLPPQFNFTSQEERAVE